MRESVIPGKYNRKYVRENVLQINMKQNMLFNPEFIYNCDCEPIELKMLFLY